MHYEEFFLSQLFLLKYIYSLTHPLGFCCLIDGDEVVFLMFLWIPTDQTDELLIVLTEELKFLSVQTAELFRVSSLTPLLSQGISQVPQCQITWRLTHWKDFLTNRARVQSTLSPPLLKTGLTEAVTTQQENRILKDIAAHWAGALHFRWWHVCSHSVNFSCGCPVFLVSDRQLYFHFHRCSVICSATAQVRYFLKQILQTNTHKFPVTKIKVLLTELFSLFLHTNYPPRAAFGAVTSSCLSKRSGRSCFFFIFIPLQSCLTLIHPVVTM